MSGTSSRLARHGRPTRAVAALSLTLSVAGGMAFSGCSSSPSPQSSGAAPGGQATAQGYTVEGEWPLTGLPATGAAPKHPVMVVKIDNSLSSSPQIGLSKADLITEELVEGGITRLAVFYYQKVPKLVGPVRSMRASDIGIVKPAKAVLVASGGAPPTVRRVKAAGIKAFTEGAVGYVRDSSRTAPYNLFMHLDKLAKKVKAKDTVPSYLPFGSAKALPKGRPAKRFDAVFSSGHTTRWSYHRGTYVNDNSNAAAGDQFRPDSVLVLRVRIGDAGYLDPAGNHVPVTEFTGSGKALLFHGGRVVHGTWSKTLDSTISLRDTKGSLSVPTGHTWIELVPKHGGAVTIVK